MRRALSFAAVAAWALSMVPSALPEDSSEAFAANRRLGRGINLGNALEAPSEGAWGMTLKEEYFPLIRSAGFNSVRIPVRWSAHAQLGEPYTVDPAFLSRVRWAVEQAVANQLAVVLNIHHYDELYANPLRHRARFLALWRQIADAFAKSPDSVYFELLNEPHDKLDADQWNALLLESLAIIRKSNPTRIVVIGPAQWNGFRHIESLKLPSDDRRLIVTFHYYEPMAVTHQAASWVRGSQRWLGTKWTASDKETRDIRAAFNAVETWSKREHRPIFLGEFGAYSRADMDTRARWTRFVREQAEERGYSWAYWEFASGFGAFDRSKDAWRKPLLTALTGAEAPRRLN